MRTLAIALGIVSLILSSYSLYLSFENKRNAEGKTWESITSHMIVTAYWMNCLEHMMISSKSEIQQRKKMEIIAIGKNIVDKISRVNTGGHSVGKILECYKFM